MSQQVTQAHTQLRTQGRGQPISILGGGATAGLLGGPTMHRQPQPQQSSEDRAAARQVGGRSSAILVPTHARRDRFGELCSHPVKPAICLQRCSGPRTVQPAARPPGARREGPTPADGAAAIGSAAVSKGDPPAGRSRSPIPPPVLIRIFTRRLRILRAPSSCPPLHPSPRFFICRRVSLSTGPCTSPTPS